MNELFPLYLSLYISCLSTVILLLFSIPIAWFLVGKKNIFKRITEIIVTLPLVLSPTILGFYLLIIFNQDAVLGKLWFRLFGSTIMFSMSGLVIGSIIYSLPFAIQPIQVAFSKISIEIIDQAYLLQLSKLSIFIKIIIPLSKNGILTSIILTFVHTLGEFGVVLMIGGNIPGKTQVVSIAIYESVEMLNYSVTHQLSLIVLIISVIILLILFSVNKRDY
ncbi:MAG TPA: molybdate ABC transporter permease subunit [Candidatus Azoamicus sp. OHIO2]